MIRERRHHHPRHDRDERGIWELVSHNQPFFFAIEGQDVLPTVEVYNLKKPVEQRRWHRMER